MSAHAMYSEPRDIVDLLIRLEELGPEVDRTTIQDVIARSADLRDALERMHIDPAELEQRWAELRYVDRRLFADGEDSTSRYPTIPGFEIQGEIGRGGMGVVVLARQIGLGRDVALKLIMGGKLASLRARQRFHAEAQAIARLRDPHIIQIHDSGEAEHELYLVMEFLSGGTLAERTARGPQPLREAAQLVEQLAHGVDHAHRQGILHRDLKPANVLFDEKGMPKICDFGLAKCLENDAQLTATGEVTGSPSYMAPEQISGKDLGERTDVYGLGAILYELLTGRAPFEGESTAETLIHVRRDMPTAPRRLRREVPADLEAICLKCLEKSPAKRYASANALAEDLRRWLHGEPTAARSVGNVGRLTRWAKREPVVATLVAAIFLVLATLAAVSSWGSARMAAALNRESELRTRAEAAQRDAVSNQKQAQQHVYAAQIKFAQQAWRLGKLPEFLDLLDDYSPADMPAEDLRGFEWHYLKSLYDQGRTTLRADDSGEVYHVAFCADESQLITANQDGTVCFWNVENGELVDRFKAHDACVNSIAVAPDGEHFATASCDGTVKWWSLGSHEPIWVFSEHTAPVHCLALAVGGGWLVSGSEDETAKVWDLTTGERLGSLGPHGEYVISIDISADESRILTAARDKPFVWIWDANDPGQLDVKLRVDSAVRVARFGATSDRIVTVESHAKTIVRNIPAGERLHVFEEPPDICCLEVFFDGAQCVTGRESGVVEFRALDGEAARETRKTVNANEGHLTHLAVSRSDPRWLATASTDGTARVFELDAVRDYQRLGFELGEVTAAALSGPAGLIALAKQDGNIELRDLATSEIRRLWKRTSAWRVSEMRFSQDGTSLVLFPHDAKDVEPEKHRVASLLDEPSAPPSVLESRTAEYERPAIQIQAGKRDHVEYASPSAGQLLVTISDRFTGVEHGLADGMVALTSHGHVELFDYRSGRHYGRFHGPGGLALRPAYSWDGQLVALGSPHGARLFVIETGHELAKLVGHEGGVTAIAFSPDGRSVATGSDDRTIRLWNVPTGQEMLVLEGHSSAIRGLAFTSDGSTLVSWCKDAAPREYGLDWPGEIFFWRAGPH